MASSRLKLVLALLWISAVAALGAAVWFLVLSPDRERIGTAEFGRGNYQLVTHAGEAFTESSLRGQPSLVFFGFTHCPDVCPTTIGDIMAWQEDLGGAADDLRVFFVTVDPERDTPEVLAEYIGWLPGAVGVTGTQDDINIAMRAFRVFARRVPTAEGDYTMDHSSSVLLFSVHGEFVTNISYHAPLEEALERLRRLF